MSKTGAWYLDMCEDAGVLTKDEFIKKHGEHNLDIWNEVNECDLDIEPVIDAIKSDTNRLDEIVKRMNKAFTKKISQC